MDNSKLKMNDKKLEQADESNRMITKDGKIFGEILKHVNTDTIAGGWHGKGTYSKRSKNDNIFPPVIWK